MIYTNLESLYNKHLLMKKFTLVKNDNHVSNLINEINLFLSINPSILNNYTTCRYNNKYDLIEIRLFNRSLLTFRVYMKKNKYYFRICNHDKIYKNKKKFIKTIIKKLNNRTKFQCFCI